MNTARWLVILSVIFCMITVLTILHRSANSNILITSQEHERTLSQDNFKQDQNQDEYKQVSFKRPTRSKYETNSIQFSKPPKQIFEMDTNQNTQNENKQLKTEGKILD